MKQPKATIPEAGNDRKQRMAQALRENLHLRKARARVSEKDDATTEQGKDKINSSSDGSKSGG